MPRVTITNSAGTPLANDTATALPVIVSSATSTINVIPTTTVSFNSLESAATTNAISLKTTAGSLLSLVLTNTSATTKYFKLYNKTSAPTVGTDIPTITLVIPASGNIIHNFGFGLRFPAGIAYAITGAMPNSDTTAVAAGDVKVHIGYL